MLSVIYLVAHSGLNKFFKFIKLRIFKIQYRINQLISKNHTNTNAPQSAHPICFFMAQRHRSSIFERKVLRKIFGPVRVGDNFRIQSNSSVEKFSTLVLFSVLTFIHN